MTRVLARTLALLAALAVVWLLATGLPIPDVQVVRIEGDLTSAERQQVRGAVDAALSASDWASASGLAGAVQALGWVREVRVRRQWPDALHVAVRRHTVAARWGDDGWLTAGGEVVPTPHGVDAFHAGPLPVFDTVHADAPRAMRVFGLLNTSAEAAGLAVEGLFEDASGNWTAVVANGVPLLLGARDLRERFARFAAVYRAELIAAGRPIERVDARYDGGIAVRWRRPDGQPASPKTLQLAAAAFSAPGKRHGVAEE